MKWLSAFKSRRYRPSVNFLIVLFLVVLGSLTGRVAADTFVQSFNALNTIEPGWVVAVSKTASDTVEPAPADDSSRIYGVVINPSQSPVTLQHQGQQVFVANSGNYPVLVSTQNGTIKAGDYISMSSIDGIAAKATSQESTVLGRALQAFDGKTNIITSSHGAAIGSITVSISVGSNPTQRDDVAIPSTLRTLGQSIAGKSVSAIRIYSALGIFVITAVVASILLWVGVRSGMIAIGRNPLSRHSIFQSLTQVAIVAILIFIAGLFGVYLLLRL